MEATVTEGPTECLGARQDKWGTWPRPQAPASRGHAVPSYDPGLSERGDPKTAKAVGEIGVENTSGSKMNILYIHMSSLSLSRQLCR